ncbi:MAG TPA: FUSC family protein [Candidatus Dorea stercoravium]|nr:FUSC family protein [Candidatus Dorea stercoravium]
MMRERLESQARIVWKSFLGALPVICFYLFLFCTVLALFGTQYIMVVSLVTVLFQTNYRKRKSWASLVRAAAAQLGLGLLAWIATWSFPLSVGLNLIVPFALVFLKATRFNKMGYFSGLMTFTFLQLLPVDLAGFFVQAGAMLYSLACFFLLVKLYQRRYPQEKSYRREQEGLAILADTPFWEKAARTALEERGDELLGEAGEGEDELHISVRNFLHPFLILLRKFDEGERDEAGASWPMPRHQRPLGKLLYQMRPDGFETRFALRMSAVLTISFLFVHISGADHAYWLPLNAFLLLRPMYEDSRYRMLTRFLGTAGGCIIMSLLFPVLPGMQGHFVLAALMVICMYTATPGTCVHAVCVTCFALSMVTLAMGEETAIELRMVYVMGAVFLVLVINRFFFPTNMGQQFRYNLTVVFHMHHMYLRMLERALERPTDYGTICDAQVEYHLVHSQMMEYLDKRKGQLWELYRELLGISWEMAAEIEQILLFVNSGHLSEGEDEEMENYIAHAQYVLAQVQERLGLRGERTLPEVRRVSYSRGSAGQRELSYYLTAYAKHISMMYRLALEYRSDA